MPQNLECPSCKSINVKEYKNVVLGVILVAVAFPLGILYLILTPKYKCLECKKLFPRTFEGTKIGKIGNIFLALFIAFLIYGMITVLWTIGRG